MANVKKVTLANGETRWRMRLYVGRDPDTGKQEIITGTFDRKKDADAEVTRLKAMRQKGGLVMPSKEPLGKYLDKWLRTVKKGNLRARTYSDYRGVLARYIQDPPEGAPRIGSIPLNQLAPQAIQDLYHHLQEEEGLSPRTIRSVHAVVRQGLAHAARVGALGRNVADLVVLPKRDRREVKAMSPEEADRFLKAAREDRYYALWCVLLTGGLRPGEALALRWGPDVDLDASKVHVQRTLTRRGLPRLCECGHLRDVHQEEGKGACGDDECEGCQRFRNARGWALVPPKTARARRVVALPGFVVQALRSWKAKQAEERLKVGPEYEDHGFVFTNEFGKPLDGANLYARNFTRIMAGAELGEWDEPEERAPGTPGPQKRPKFRPAYRLYDLRHTAATLLLRAREHPKVVSERLGHASVAFTLDVYSASVPDMQDGAVEKLEAMLGGS